MDSTSSRPLTSLTGTIDNSKASSSTPPSFRGAIRYLGDIWNDMTGKTRQNEYNERMMDKQNAYNSPAAQISRLMQAGYTEKQAMESLMGVTPTPSATPAPAESGGGLAGMIGTVSAIGQQSADTVNSLQAAIGQQLQNQVTDATKGMTIERMNQEYIHSIQETTRRMLANDGLTVDNAYKRNMLDWQRTCQYYQEQGMSLEEITNILNYRMMVLDLTTDPFYFSTFGDMDINDKAGYAGIDIGLPANVGLKYNGKEQTNLTIPPDVYEDLSDKQQDDYVKIDIPENLQQGFYNYPFMYVYKDSKDAIVTGFDNLKVIKYANEQFYNDAIADLYASRYDKEAVINELSTQQQEFSNWVHSLKNDEKKLLVQGNIEAIRQKIYETKESGEAKWWQMGLMLMELIAESGLGAYYRPASFSFGMRRNNTRARGSWNNTSNSTIRRVGRAEQYNGYGAQTGATVYE